MTQLLTALISKMVFIDVGFAISIGILVLIITLFINGNIVSRTTVEVIVKDAVKCTLQELIIIKEKGDRNGTDTS